MWNSRSYMPTDDLTGRRGVVARAFELARSGEFSHIRDLRDRLILERYSNVNAHLAGISVRRQLKALFREAGEPTAMETEAQAPP
jgi:hypothetical protein